MNGWAVMRRTYGKRPSATAFMRFDLQTSTRNLTPDFIVSAGMANEVHSHNNLIRFLDKVQARFNKVAMLH